MKKYKGGRILSPAKVNLHLEITGRRPDGFHDIRSLFVMTSFADAIELEITDPGSGFSLTGDFSCSIQQNLITQACMAFAKKTEIPGDFSVNVEKIIPEGAGLGGGSGNAASVLRILDTLYPDALSEPELMTIAELLGSDVSFFLKSPAAVVEGRGERVIPVPVRTDYSLLLCLPEIHINTKQAYNWFDNKNESNNKQKSISVHDIRQIYSHYAPDKWLFFNSFFPVISQRYSQYKKINMFLEESESDFSVLSGSGACFTGVFSENKNLAKVKARLSQEGIQSVVAHPLAVMPIIELF